MTNLHQIGKKWQKKWEQHKIFKVTENYKKKKFYCLEMFPYPSGYGLHMGHAFNYTVGDIQARYKRMLGLNVLYPMGYDAFGLPAENAAIKVGEHPSLYTKRAIKRYIQQQKGLGLSYDWDRIVNTSEPEYYKWNQYFFLKFLENDLVYKKKAQVNWCPNCNTVLANEQVHNGYCWRHEDTLVEEKELEQWFIKTTKYAKEHLKDLKKLEWPYRIKLMQKNWIGKSEGMLITHKVKNFNIKLNSFTAYPSWSFADTFLVIAPEHPLALKLVEGTEYEQSVIKFIDQFKNEKIVDQSKEAEKTGVFTGRYAIDPLTGEEMPIWLANFVLLDFGTGIIRCSAHDPRDLDFATKYNIQLKEVVDRVNNKPANAHDNKGILKNSKQFNGKDVKEAEKEICNWMTKQGFGKKTTQYRLKDWLISRQRYWGTPIPIIYCKDCGIIPASYKDLPIKLPTKVKFGKGNPLSTNKSFVNTKCPNCKKSAKRETDTMDTFFDSSWYFLRYCDNKNKTKPFDIKKIKYWMPVDQYIGGAEHACMHLIYARFFTKVLRDLKLIPKIDEPFLKLFNQGMLHAQDGNKMSKSLGNIIEPETISKKYGIDTARLFLVSIVSPDKDLNWSDQGIEGSYRFLKKIVSYFKNIKISKSSVRVESKLNSVIKEVTTLIENFEYNIAVIKIRELFETLEETVSKKTLEDFLKLLNPFCPHLTEELWTKLGNKPFLSLQKWPKFDPKKINPLFDYGEKLKSQIKTDIEQIIKLIKIKPKTIKLIISAPWKYSFFSKFKKELEKTRDFKILISKLLDKEHNEEIVKLIQSGLKDSSKIPSDILTQQKEETILKKFNLDYNIFIIKEQDSNEPKSKQAIPGKPAIILE